MQARYQQRQRQCLILGGIAWAVLLWFVFISTYRVMARMTRPAITLTLDIPEGTDVVPREGDGVFAATDLGLTRIGEVSTALTGASSLTLTVDAEYRTLVNQSTTAELWHTPLSMEHAVHALLPPEIQRRVLAEIERGWVADEEEIVTSWKPIVTELSAAYVDLIADDIREALNDRQNELLAVAQVHADVLAHEWPVIQERLSPILQEHLTPVLGRLLSEAVDEAPKTRIAWQIARGRIEGAFQLMLDWLSEYLGNMPEADRKELNDALITTWDQARNDPVITERFAKLGRDIRDDQRLQDILLEVYRDAIAENPQTSAFIQERILDSPRVQQAVYRFLELFGPTARNVVGHCLFDAEGTTRPEVVFLVRSIAVGRQVAWVTLRTTDPSAAPLESGARVPVTAEERAP